MESPLSHRYDPVPCIVKLILVVAQVIWFPDVDNILAVGEGFTVTVTGLMSVQAPLRTPFM